MGIFILRCLTGFWYILSLDNGCRTIDVILVMIISPIFIIIVVYGAWSYAFYFENTFIGLVYLDVYVGLFPFPLLNLYVFWLFPLIPCVILYCLFSTSHVPILYVWLFILPFCLCMIEMYILFCIYWLSKRLNLSIFVIWLCCFFGLTWVFHVKKRRGRMKARHSACVRGMYFWVIHLYYQTWYSFLGVHSAFWLCCAL